METPLKIQQCVWGCVSLHAHPHGPSLSLCSSEWGGKMCSSAVCLYCAESLQLHLETLGGVSLSCLMVGRELDR